MKRETKDLAKNLSQALAATLFVVSLAFVGAFLMGATEVTDTVAPEFYRATGSSPMDEQIPESARHKVRALRELRVAFSSTTPPNGLTVTIAGAQTLEYTVYVNASSTSLTQLTKQFDPPHLISSDQTIELDWTKTSGGTDSPTWQIEVIYTNE